MLPGFHQISKNWGARQMTQATDYIQTDLYHCLSTRDYKCSYSRVGNIIIIHRGENVGMIEWKSEDLRISDPRNQIKKIEIESELNNTRINITLNLCDAHGKDSSRSGNEMRLGKKQI